MNVKEVYNDMVVLMFPLFLPILAWILWLWLSKKMVRTSRAAILATAIPAPVLAIASAVLGQGGRSPYYPVAAICGQISLGLAVAAVLSSVVFAIMREWEIAKGTGFGSGISWFVYLMVFWVAFAVYA